MGTATDAKSEESLRRVLLDTNDVAAITGLTPARIWQLCDAGEMGKKIGRQYIIELGEVVDYAQKVENENRIGSGWRPRTPIPDPLAAYLRLKEEGKVGHEKDGTGSQAPD